jgi:uncharacterized protein
VAPATFRDGCDGCVPGKRHIPSPGEPVTRPPRPGRPTGEQVGLWHSWQGPLFRRWGAERPSLGFAADWERSHSSPGAAPGGSVHGMGTPTVRDLLQQALVEALKTRDIVAVSALRSALGAIDNANAVPVSLAPVTGATSPHFAGAAAGLGAGETERRALSDQEASAIVRAEVAERQAAARDYERAGHTQRAGRLRREADILASMLAVEP